MRESYNTQRPLQSSPIRQNAQKSTIAHSHIVSARTLTYAPRCCIEASTFYGWSLWYPIDIYVELFALIYAITLTSFEFVNRRHLFWLPFFVVTWRFDQRLGSADRPYFHIDFSIYFQFHGHFVSVDLPLGNSNGARPQHLPDAMNRRNPWKWHSTCAETDSCRPWRRWRRPASLNTATDCRPVTSCLCKSRPCWCTWTATEICGPVPRRIPEKLRPKLPNRNDDSADSLFRHRSASLRMTETENERKPT